MEDSNLIAYFALPHGPAQGVIGMRQNSGRYILPQQNLEPEHDSRESTVSEDDEETDPTCFPRLQLTFNPGPKASQGFVIGTDENCCDIVLPKLNKISRRHCCLTFDKKRRLILRDLSSHGTIVTYDGQGDERRRTIVETDETGRKTSHHFTWILSDVELNEVKEIVIKIGAIAFIVLIPKRQTPSALYNNNVDRFLQEANADNELPFGALGMQSTTSTVQHSRTKTPIRQIPIYIRQARVGHGAFSIVHRVWDVSSGSVYASKEFLNMKETEWEKEASIMRQISEFTTVNPSRLRKIIC